jgi:cystathionine beta-lyase/cystathionine gamma-synthase
MTDLNKGRDLLDPATLGIHGGEARREWGEPVVPPIFQSATFFGGGPDDPKELLYTRYGNNPNQLQVAAKVAALEGMEAGLALGSGMAAISLTLLSLVRNEDHIISSRDLYGATRTFMEFELPRRGVHVSFVDPAKPREWRNAVRSGTRLLYLELPANPTLRVADPRPLAALAHEQGVPLVVDATFATPMNFRAGENGVDVVIHSATKYLGGHSDLTAGLVCGSADMVREVRGLLKLYGPALDPHAAWLLDRGLRTLPIRMEGHNRSGLALAEWLEAQPEVERVIYPGLPSHPDHEVARKILGGFGGVLGVELKGGVRAADAFVASLRVASVAPSLGGVETLVSLPRLTSHRAMSAQERAAQGIPDGFVRISVGLEGVQDLQDDFRLALDRAGSG